MQDVKTMAFCLCAGCTRVVGGLIVSDSCGGNTKEALMAAKGFLVCVHEDNAVRIRSSKTKDKVIPAQHAATRTANVDISPGSIISLSTETSSSTWYGRNTKTATIPAAVLIPKLLQDSDIE